MNQPLWLQVTIERSPEPDDWSPWIEVLERWNCQSTLETADPPALVGYISWATSPDRQRELEGELRKRGADSVRFEEIVETDWSVEWKKHFRPQRVGERWVICPSWEVVQPEPEDLVIVLDPGQAFGTGDHPTTRLCLEELERCDLVHRSVWDVGCGSGILSIAARMRGAVPVLGTDVDPTAVEVARANAERNGVEVEFRVGEGVERESRDGGWDVVVSNIISATLTRLAPNVFSVLKPGGVWITSGIYEGNVDDVRTSAVRAGFEALRQETESQWAMLSFRKPSNS